MSGDLIIWILGAAALIAVVTAGAALAAARRAAGVRDALVAGVQDLGSGDLGRRLAERDVGPVAAAAFNQAARDLDMLLEQARRTAAILRRLADEAGERVVLDIDTEGEVREVLGDLEGLLGHLPVAVTGRHAAFFFASEEDWARLQAASAQGTSRPIPSILRRSDGELTSGAALWRPHQDGGGHLMLGAAEAAAAEPAGSEDQASAAPDESEAAAAAPEEGPDARRARLAEERLAAFAGALPQGVALLLDGVVVSVSPRFASILGCDAGSLEGKPLTALAVADDAVRAASLALGVPTAGESETELRLKAAGGEVTLAASVGLMESEGRVLRLLAVRDISMQRERRERLERSAAWLGAALEASADGLAVLPVGRGAEAPAAPAVANARFLELMGLPTRRLPDGEEMRRAVSARFRDPVAAHGFLFTDPRADTAPAVAVLATLGTPERSLELTRLPVRDGAGRLQGRLVVIRDVSREHEARDGLTQRADDLERDAEESRAAARRLQAERADLERTVERLESACAEMEERDEMKNNLLGNFTHELQSPMVSIRGYTEMMLRGDLGPITAEQRQGLEVALRNAKRLAGLVDQLMTFARTEEALTELTLEAFPVWALLEESIGLLGDRVKEKELSVTTRYDTDLLTVMADRNLISQVFSNVLGNAVKYSRQGGEVAVTVRSGGAEELVVDVRDTGVGVPPEEHERIFERGYRASTAGGTRGSGIGLALVQEILKRHGCRIRIDSTPGEGSTFSFSLPLASDEGDAGES